VSRRTARRRPKAAPHRFPHRPPPTYRLRPAAHGLRFDNEHDSNCRVGNRDSAENERQHVTRVPGTADDAGVEEGRDDSHYKGGGEKHVPGERAVAVQAPFTFAELKLGAAYDLPPSAPSRQPPAA
jgi:hypothetical protein